MNFNIDLKSIDLKNISLEDIQAKLKNVEKKTWIKIGSVVGAVVLFLNSCHRVELSFFLQLDLKHRRK